MVKHDKPGKGFFVEKLATGWAVKRPTGTVEAILPTEQEAEALVKFLTHETLHGTGSGRTTERRVYRNPVFTA